MTLPTLEQRFYEPAGWQWGSFSNAGKINIRYGFASPAAPEATIVVLPGRTEFIEKYFETARDLIAQNFAVYVIDWAGQGQSGRFAKTFPERGHAQDFSSYAHDLHLMIKNHVRLEAPLVMLAHSMGANIGLRYLAQYPDTFLCAGLSAPMTGIRQFRNWPFWCSLPLLWILKTLAGDSYAHGQKDWSKEERHDAPWLSGDQIRAAIHNIWLHMHPFMCQGGVTYDWLYKALCSCAVLQNPKTAACIQIPCLIGVAGREMLVDNAATRRLADRLPRAALEEFPDSGHEILMERDDIRGEFLAYFYTMVRENTV